MTRFACLLCLVAVGFVATAGCASEQGLSPQPALVLDHQRDAVSLAGTWNVLRDHADSDLWRADAAAAAGPWLPASLPSNEPLPDVPAAPEAIKAFSAKTVCLWVRRSFDLDQAHAARDAVLRWNGIRFGATAWINGQLATQRVQIGPHTVLLPRGLLHAGRNEIVLKIPGWAGVPKSKSGYPLTPTYGAVEDYGNKAPGLYQDIWLEFYDRVYAKWVLAMPNLAEKSVTFRVWLDGVAPRTEAVTLETVVRELGARKDLASSKATVGPDQGAPFIDIPCRLPDVKPWTPQTPFLYEAEVRATAGKLACDTVRFQFGLRQVTTADGHFRLNGQPLWLRGSDLVNEPLRPNFKAHAKEYLVDEARSMNLNSFRTQLLSPFWLDLADRHGLMLVTETAILYNHADFKFTPEELEIFHRNALPEVTAWVTRAWNHPSIVLWNLSNESRLDNEWESGPLFAHVKALDPTRLDMRAGEGIVGTPDLVDFHACFYLNNVPEGQFLEVAAARLARKDPARPLCNTEYINLMGGESTRWCGRDNHPDWPLTFAELNTEHTEAMRRLRYDCQLAFMYANWTRTGGKNNWRPDYPSPMAASLHSSMAPVLASLELFDRNYVVGREVETHFTLINETHAQVAAKLDFYLTPVNPVFVPDAKALAAATWHTSQEVTLPADSQSRQAFRWPVPKTEGTYYLAAVLSRSGDTPVVSQRVVHAVDPDKTAAVKGRRVFVLGADDDILSWLKERGGVVVTSLSDSKVAADVVLVWDAAKLTAAERATAPALREFARTGGRLVVANQTAWSWPELADLTIGRPEDTGWKEQSDRVIGPLDLAEPLRICWSRAFASDGVTHPLTTGVPADWLWRWNGLPGTIVEELVLSGPALAQGRKLFWVGNPQRTAVLSLPTGQGETLFCQLQVRHRLRRDSAAYDPVAERVLVNLLTRCRAPPPATLQFLPPPGATLKLV